MIRAILFFFMIFSLLTMVIVTISINSLFSYLGMNAMDFDTFIDLLFDDFSDQGLHVLAGLLQGVFYLYGMPLIVFIVSLNGLQRKY